MIDRQTEQFYTQRGEEWAAVLPHEHGPELNSFLDRLTPGAHILDLGCGDGRDAQHMEQRGFDVDAADGVAKMVELASRRLKKPARQMLFSQLTAVDSYDAIWANASLQHAPAKELPNHLLRVYRALKPSGWHFSSYKGGEGGKRDQEGRFFSFISAEDLAEAYDSAGEWGDFDIKSEMGSSFGNVPMEWHHVWCRKAPLR